MKPTTTSKRNGIDDIDRLLDEALQQTFPACDLVACTWAPSRRPASTRRTASSAACDGEPRPVGSERPGTRPNPAMRLSATGQGERSRTGARRPPDPRSHL
ncbi:hypothetical protein SAMN04487926_1628 [Paraburkholderia steynii]|uniref:Uncharacterized protein n=1 Tax=Paraburkholderia steynii TaxID=1245441 RepID=A0A7Z7FPP8_9BURK|nr:hypothetical protein SAMN04487926_1628 [Paraburkholderia steynii]